MEETKRILAACKVKEDLVRLVEICRSRGMRGVHGTWEEFLKVYDETYGQVFVSPSERSKNDSLRFLKSLRRKSDLAILALSLRPTRCMVYDYSREVKNESVQQSLVRRTLCHPDHHFEYLAPFRSDDLVLTESKWDYRDASLLIRVPLHRKMIAVRCAIVACADGSEAAAVVVAVDERFNVLLDTFVKPDKPVVDYKTDITGITAEDVENAEALSSLADVQTKLKELFSYNVIMVGHHLSKDLRALKMDHARVIDLSALIPNKRPSLDGLCQFFLSCDLPKPNGSFRCFLEAIALVSLARSFVNFYATADASLKTFQRERTFVIGFKHRLKLQRKLGLRGLVIGLKRELKLRRKQIDRRCGKRR